jgi:hypothetical protein
MPASKHHAPQDRTGRKQDMPPAHQAAETSAELPSSFGDSPKRVTPKDITPEHASWADLKVTDVGANRTECVEATPSDVPEKALAGGSDTAVDAGSHSLPSSHGDSPQEVTPKDITPDDAAWKDVTKRALAPVGTAQGQDTHMRQEALIDESSELSFPASDPPAAMPESAIGTQAAACETEEEAQLDDAIELTFPASDPIAVSQITKIIVDGVSNRR